MSQSAQSGFAMTPTSADYCLSQSYKFNYQKYLYNVMQSIQDLSDSQKSLLSGGIAGCTGKTFTAPLSRLTVLLQVGAVHQCQHRSAVQSLFHTGKTILNSQGIKSFWKGNLTAICHRFPYSAINFTLYEKFRDFLCDGEGITETPAIRFISGALAGSLACAASYPIDLVRVRLVVDSHGTYRGISGAFASILKEDGVRGLYRGLTASLLVVTPNLALTYSVYGTVKSYTLDLKHPLLTQVQDDGRQTITFAGSLLCGSVSGLISSTLLFPADVVRRLLQVQGFNFRKPVAPTSTDIATLGGEQQKLGAFETARNIFRKNGFRGFYRGFLPEMLKITPMVAITYSTFELCSNVLNTKSRL